VAAIVDHPGSDEEREHLAGYSGVDARLVGYLVQARAPGFQVGLLVDAITGQVYVAGPQFGLEPWAVSAPRGEGEQWALAHADLALDPVLQHLRVTDELQRGVCGYVVGWPGVGDLTMWIDIKGNLRGGNGIL
jgi:hypothetical protein